MDDAPAGATRVVDDDEDGPAAAIRRTQPSPSPDGTRLAWISDRDGRPRAFVAPLPADGSPVVEPADALDPGPGAGPCPDVTALAWSPDGRWLACQTAPYGGERTRVVLVDPDHGSAASRNQVAPSAAATVLGAWSPNGRTLGVTIFQEGRGEGVACLVDVRDGSSTVLASGVAALVCAVGGDGHRAVVRTGPRGARRLELVDLRRGRRTELVRDAVVAAARFGVSGGTLLLHTDARREHPALLAVSLGERGEVSLSRVLASRPDQDLDLVALDPGGARAALAWNDGGLSRLEVADLRGGRGPPLATSAAVVTGTAFTRDGAALIVAGHGPARAPYVERIPLGPAGPPRGGTDGAPPGRRDTAGVAANGAPPGPGGALTSGPSPLLGGAVVPAVVPTPETLTGADGLDLYGWLIRPPGSDGPAPAMLWLHGGPESEERPGFAPLLQWLAAAGITVFAPNVRGSSGRGRTFTAADDRDRRAFSVTDVRAAVAHLVSTGVADPRRVAVGGRSYGGFLTLAALTRFPELFAAGVDVCGMSDLQTFYASTEPWVAADAVREYGDPVVDAGLLRSLSPIHAADRIAAPLLVVHGEHDTNVPLGEGARIAAALRARGAPVTEARYPDEGHEIHDRHARARFVRDTGRWVCDALGVRSG